jgi:hypothetical protein
MNEREAQPKGLGRRVGPAEDFQHWQSQEAPLVRQQASIRDYVQSVFSRMGMLEKLTDQLRDKLEFVMPPAEPHKCLPSTALPTDGNDSELAAALTKLGSDMDELAARLSDMVRRVQL